MSRLNQIIAVEKGVKTKAERALTEAYKQLQKAQLFGGISRVYRPKDEDGDQLPAEQTRVQLHADQILVQLGRDLERLFDVTLTKEAANCTASADVVVDGHALLTAVPVTYLLFLEKKLVDLRTFLSKLPVLDPSEKWSYDANVGAWATEPFGTARSKKVPRNHVKAAATERHPAQVEVWHEDVMVGTWQTTKYSGALPADRVARLVDRADTLLAAVKCAREEANGAAVADLHCGETLFSWLLAN